MWVLSYGYPCPIAAAWGWGWGHLGPPVWLQVMVMDVLEWWPCVSPVPAEALWLRTPSAAVPVGRPSPTPHPGGSAADGDPPQLHAKKRGSDPTGAQRYHSLQIRCPGGQERMGRGVPM